MTIILMQMIKDTRMAVREELLKNNYCEIFRESLINPPFNSTSEVP